VSWAEPRVGVPSLRVGDPPASCIRFAKAEFLPRFHMSGKRRRGKTERKWFEFCKVARMV